MASMDPENRRRSQQLSLALRAVRRARSMKARDIAAAMGMELRTYYHFESGGGELKIGLVFRFAQVTSSDPFAILAGALFGPPDLAEHCADNKMMIALAIALQEFATDLGSDIQKLETSTLVAAFSKLFEELAAEVRAQADWTEKWLDQKSPNVGVPKRRTPESKPEDEEGS